MPARRLRPPAQPLTFTLDGDRIEADEGEPLAFALIAADRLLLARSPKLHRPRGPFCLRGACDGCLARVDGVPNVMTCLVHAHAGARVETQNVLGSRTLDLLRATDWFFPKGIDHHHFLAGVPGLSPIMQSIARRVAGLGLLPEAVRPVAPGADESVDALIVGAGPAGIAAASTLAAAGLGCVLVDDGPAPGGSLLAYGAQALADALARYPLGGVEVRPRTTAAGIYEGRVLLAGPERSGVVTPRLLVLASGAHEGVLPFENNDLPGVLAARAGCRLLEAGITPGARVVVAGHGPYARRFVERAGSLVALHLAEDAEIVRVDGLTRVNAVTLREGGAPRQIEADALLVDAPGAPAFELAGQAGAQLAYRPGRGYVPERDEDGRALPGIFVVGGAAGLDPGPEAALADGRRVAEAALAKLG
ncbi:MAG: (2Fe-2S)-binding protein [Polyangiaceae bacterium]|nr:(2Fe-2S)-binding protein [Polyangiaceae bacterium]